MSLDEISTSFRGEYITKKDSRTGNIPVILGGQEPAYYIDKANHAGEIVVVARSGASAGFVSYWNEPVFITDGFGYENNPSLVTAKYLFYILKNRETELNAMKRGAGVPHISGGALAEIQFRFLYKGIIIKHNKTEPTYTKTSLFLCEKRRFLWPGLRKEGNLFKLAGPGGLAFFHLTKKEVSKWPMKK